MNTRQIHASQSWIARLWQADALLLSFSSLMVVVLLASVAGLWLDPRIIGGAPAWLKPAKFAASTGLYALTLAWVFGHLPAWPRTRRLVGRTTVLAIVLEVVIIGLQAWRGTTSHFNVATPMDGLLYGVMGIAILAQTLASVAVAVALWRQSFADRALGWALRIGMTITIVGAASGGLMTQPTATQLAQARATGTMAVAGGHTVGGLDGGPGGDLRVPHFVGLHGLQALIVLAWPLRRAVRSDEMRVRLTRAVGSSYAVLFGVLLWQALRGQSVLAPDLSTTVAMAGWLVLSAAAGAQRSFNQER